MSDGEEREFSTRLVHGEGDKDPGTGAIAVPISTREQMPGIAYMLAQSAAKVLVHEAGRGRAPARARASALGRRRGRGLARASA